MYSVRNLRVIWSGQPESAHAHDTDNMSMGGEGHKLLMMQ